MIAQANEALLNTLVNEAAPESKDSNVEFDGQKTLDVSGVITLQQIEINNYTIVVTTYGQVLVYDSEFNLILRDYPYLSGELLRVQAICNDEDGNIYAIGKSDTDSKFVLLYLNNITEKTADGTYQIVIKQDYNIDQMLLDIVSAIGGFTYVPTGGIRMTKCPFDSRFLFIFDGIVKNYSGQYPHNKNVYICYYKVNFGSSNNEYEYRAAKIGSLDTFDTQAIYAAWNESNVDMAFLGTNKNQATTLGNMVYYSCRVNFSTGSTISQTQLVNLANTRQFSNGNCAEYWDINNYIIGYQEISGTTSSLKLVAYRNNSRMDILTYPAKDTTTNLISFIKIGNQIFSLERNLQDGDTWYTDAKHIYKPSTDYDYVLTVDIWTEDELEDQPNGLLLGTRAFNVYNLIINNYKIVYIYRENGYNQGEGYTEKFLDQNTTSHDTSLYGYSPYNSFYKKTLFNRNLYNKTLIGNAINSVVQVPYNYLNDVPIIEEKLYANTNATIDIDRQEINKNQYEELYINNIDSYKVYDNNNGSTYNQSSSLLVAKQIFNGFEDEYKITHYRINYTDNTHEDKKINSTSINDNIATLDMFIYPTKEVANVQIYDKDFTTPFVTIEIEPELNKLQRIRQYVKVE